MKCIEEMFTSWHAFFVATIMFVSFDSSISFGEENVTVKKSVTRTTAEDAQSSIHLMSWTFYANNFT